MHCPRVAFQAPGVLRGVIGREGRGPSRLDLLQPLFFFGPLERGKKRPAKPATVSQLFGYDDLDLRLLIVCSCQVCLVLDDTGLFL